MPKEELPSQTKEVVYRAYKFYRQRKPNTLCEHCNDIDLSKKISEITGISQRKVHAIIEEGNNMAEDERFTSPVRPRRPPERELKIDTFTKIVIKREIAQFYQKQRQFPTVTILTQIMEDKGVYKWKHDYMRHVLQNMGFRLRKSRRRPANAAEES